MKEFKGTKAPWKIFEQFEAPLLTTCEESGSERYHLSYWIMNKNNKIIGETNYQTETNNGGWGSISNLEEMKANAKLIAAAPELLKACKYALEQINSGTALFRTDLLEDAIKKALL